MKGSSSSDEIIVNRKDGHSTWDPVSVMRWDDPIYLSKYAIDNELLNKTGWKQLCCYVKKTNCMKRLLKSAKAKQRSSTVKINFGIKIPCNHKEAMNFDANNGNIKRKDAEILELNIYIHI